MVEANNSSETRTPFLIKHTKYCHLLVSSGTNHAKLVLKKCLRKRTHFILEGSGFVSLLAYLCATPSNFWKKVKF